MREFPSASPSPARVHDRARALIGHNPCWIRRPYGGGFYSIVHFRICSYCQGAHPGDVIELLLVGESRIESAAKPGKQYLITPNPIAGDLIAMGSSPGAVFDRSHWPADLRHLLKDPARAGLEFRPSIAERLAGHFERPALRPAPELIEWPLYSEHISKSQWPEIWAAARGEKEHVPSLSSA